MNKATISTRHIEQAMEAANVFAEDFTIHGAYSGRGMFDATCPAVTMPPQELHVFVAALALELAADDRADEALALALQMRTDSMGRRVIAYWPQAELTN